jgi:hypothetical protein
MSLKIVWQAWHFCWNNVLPSCADTLVIKKTKKESNKSVSFWIVGLQEIIDTIELKNVDKIQWLAAKISHEVNKTPTGLKIF